VKLREVGNALDPLHLLEEVRALQSHLVVLAEGGKPHVSSSGEPDLSAFLASLSSAWRAGEIRPTHSDEAKPRYLRRIQSLVHRHTVAPQQVNPPSQQKVVQMEAKSAVPPDRSSMPQLDPETERQCELRIASLDEATRPAVIIVAGQLPNKRLISSCRRGITPHASCRITALMAPLLF
jgi:hypothetical protein